VLDTELGERPARLGRLLARDLAAGVAAGRRVFGAKQTEGIMRFVRVSWSR
jgi:hypothetical protein